MRRKKKTTFALDLYFTPVVKEAFIKRLSENPDKTSHVVEVLNNDGYHVWIDGIAFIKAGVYVGDNSEIMYIERMDEP